MARKSRMSILKRQRELRKAEKAARKRARRHGQPEEIFAEPVPTVRDVEASAPEPSDEEATQEVVEGDPA